MIDLQMRRMYEEIDQRLKPNLDEDEVVKIKQELAELRGSRRSMMMRGNSKVETSQLLEQTEPRSDGAGVQFV